MSQNQTLVLTVHGGNSGRNRADDGIQNRGITKNQYSTLKGEAVWSENLDKFLSGENFVSINPLFPNAVEADYTEWARFFEQVLMAPEYSRFENLILIGYSLGTTFLQRYLAENDLLAKFGTNLLQLHFVACCSFEGDFKVSANWEKIITQVSAANIYIYHSTDDPICAISEAEIFSQNLPGSSFSVFEDRGHFGQAELAELVGEIKLYYK